LVWFDALTPKQALLMAMCKFKFESLGYDTVLTTRVHDCNTWLLDQLNISYIVVGEYGGASREGKLRASLERSLKLFNVINDLEEKPCLHVSLSSPDATRIAFGLGIPIILFNDTPHSIYVNRLTLPLADKIIVPEAVPKEAFSYAVSPSKIVHYGGVDEFAWMKNFKPNISVLDELDLSVDDRIVLVRSEEVKAAYYPRSGMVPTLIFVRKLLNRLSDIKIVYLPRYEDQRKFVLKSFHDVIVPSGAIDSRSLAYYSCLVVSGGGTVVRESALLGVPSLCLFRSRLHVNDWLERRGFPIYWFKRVNDAVDFALKVLKKPDDYRVDVSSMIEELEDPVDVLIRVWGEIIG